MTTNAQHTPTPWKADVGSFQRTDGYITIIADKAGITHSIPIAKVAIYEHDGTATATAEFIVRACNSYAGLLAAAEAAVWEVHTYHHHSRSKTVDSTVCEWPACIRLRTAIAKAKPQKGEA